MLRRGGRAGGITAATGATGLAGEGGADFSLIVEPGAGRCAARHHQRAADAANAASKKASGEVTVKNGVRGGQAMAVQEDVKVGGGHWVISAVVCGHVLSAAGAGRPDVRVMEDAASSLMVRLRRDIADVAYLGRVWG